MTGLIQRLAGEPSQVIGNIQTVIGSGTLTRASGAVVQIKAGDPVCQGDVIETAADGQIAIHFIDDTVFNLSSNSRVVLSEFVCDCNGTLNSGLFDVARGSFAFTTGQVAKTGFLTIETPVASIRGRARAGGMGTLTLAGLTFAILDEVQAQNLSGAKFFQGPTFLKDGLIVPADLAHGVFVLDTKEAIPRQIIVDDPQTTIVLKATGSAISFDQVTNTPTQMALFQAAQQNALATYVAGIAAAQQTGPAGPNGPTGLTGAPTSTGSNGSSTPPSLVNPLAQPISFQPDDPSAPPPPSPPPTPTFLPPPLASTPELIVLPPGTVPPPPPPPVLTVPVAPTLDENPSGGGAVPGVIVGPPATTVSATLSVSSGTLHLGSLAGVAVSGDGSTMLIVSGDATAVNTVLAGLTYTLPVGSDEGSATLNVTLTASDGSTTTASTTITINPVAEPPTASVPAPLSLNENASSVAIHGVSVGPLAEDSNDTVSATLTVTHGTLHVGSLAGVTVSNNDSASLIVSGDAAVVNSLLDGLTYTPTAGYEGSDTLNVSATSTDGSNTYPTAATASTTITVNPVAEAAVSPAPCSPPAATKGSAIGLTIVATPVDGDDNLSINISGIPAGATLNHGTLNADGSYTLTTAQLTGLQLTSAENSGTLHVVVTSSEGTVSTTSSADIAVTVNPVAETPSVTMSVGSGTVDEGGTSTITITGTAVDSDDTLSYTLTGLPERRLPDRHGRRCHPSHRLQRLQHHADAGAAGGPDPAYRRDDGEPVGHGDRHGRIVDLGGEHRGDRDGDGHPGGGDAERDDVGGLGHGRRGRHVYDHDHWDGRR